MKNSSIFHSSFNSYEFNSLEQARKAAPGPGLYMGAKCEYCGKNRSVGDHQRCSKLRQRKVQHG